MTPDSHTPLHNQRPPYSLGWLCVIPVVGFFVGIALILYGWLRYRDRKLIFIGVGGVLFTSLIYAALFHSLRHQEPQSWQTLSQSQLDDLVCYVEFYKLEHGYFPHDLQQLAHERPFTPINDPMMTAQNAADSLQAFVYYPVGEGYTLFGRGVDGRAGTGDDLWPHLFTSDSSRIGWRKSPRP